MVLVDNEDGAVMDQITLQQQSARAAGKYEFTTLPGFNVTGMDPNSGLYLQVIPRPVKGSDPVEANAVALELELGQKPSHPNAVVVDPHGESLVIASDPDGAVANQRSANQRRAADDQGGRSDGVGIGNASALFGVFSRRTRRPSGLVRLLRQGYFAELWPSDPFLVILNDGVYEDDYPGQILAGALAINNAALLAGDYNHDDRVDAADYVMWRKTMGSTTHLAADGSGEQTSIQADYEVWRSNFGHSLLAPVAD